MDIIQLIFGAILAGIGGYIGSYAKEKGKNLASKEDFKLLKEQLERNTESVEVIKSKVSERSWIDQQTWLVKKETYDQIFELLFHIKKHVSRQNDDYLDWFYYNHYHPDLAYETHGDGSQTRLWELEKAEYERVKLDPQTINEAEQLKIKHEESLSGLLKIIDVKAIYLDENVSVILTNLKKELFATYPYEDWDEHFTRLKNCTLAAINDIQKIGMRELKIKTITE
ncbi:hypothetical protein RMN64_15625 [Plesiomonas shigelloides]|uniref:hypothetical protein n=1 Tax=Plesiomonas shigelloides TaxID=703 RepID=UPI002887C68B|nr:hypothetical protein [Plesiomonas shigelloides]MDT1012845.1 hypothetical protein [Plesiomonas shigelloides]